MVERAFGREHTRWRNNSSALGRSKLDIRFPVVQILRRLCCANGQMSICGLPLACRAEHSADSPLLDDPRAFWRFLFTTSLTHPLYGPNCGCSVFHFVTLFSLQPALQRVVSMRYRTTCSRSRYSPVSQKGQQAWYHVRIMEYLLCGCTKRLIGRHNSG